MSLLIPFLTVIAAWWVGTGVVLYLQQRLDGPRIALTVCLSLISLGSLLLLKLASQGPAAWHSYAGLLSAIGLWGCLELSYYCGLIGGTHKRPCPSSCDNRTRFRLALGASLWHEISILGAGILVCVLLWNSANPTGLYCFLVLWLMRWSAKLNLFFGVPNFSTDWFPERLAHVHSYIRRAPVSSFFPLSVGLATLVAWQLLAPTLMPALTGAGNGTSPAGSLGVNAPEGDDLLPAVLPGVLLLLAILEHLFMALPIADTALWNRIFAQDELNRPKPPATEPTSTPNPLSR
jgi:putative photosynthetic complex assembly protein 2